MMVKKIFYLMAILLTVVSVSLENVSAEPLAERHPVELLVGENLAYDVSFLWFKRLAEGSIRLERGEQPDTYLAIMEARTRGLAAFVTRDRIEKFQTLMEIGPGGLLRPLLHSSHRFKGKEDQQNENRTSYGFDYINRQVHYEKIKNQWVNNKLKNQRTVEELLPFKTEGPVYDILSAFYNLRLEAFGPLGKQTIRMPTFHRKGFEEIVVVPVSDLEGRDKKFFSTEGTHFKVLVDPSIFKTNGRELFVSFDENKRLERGIIKNVIGLGDVKGVLREVTKVTQVVD